MPSLAAANVLPVNSDFFVRLYDGGDASHDGSACPAFIAGG